MRIVHGERVVRGVHHLQIVQEVAEHHCLRRGDAEGGLQRRDRVALVRGLGVHVQPMLAGDGDLMTVREGRQVRQGAVLGGIEVVDGDLEHVVVDHLRQVVHHLQSGVVLVHLLEEGRV